MYWTKSQIAEYPDGEFVQQRVKDASLFTVKELLKKEEDAFGLVYDYGDEWMHSVTLIEKLAYPEGYEKHSGITVLDGEGACPPEDCGGEEGYKNLIHIMAGPQCQEKKDMAEWLNGQKILHLDPSDFNLRETNQRVSDYQRILGKVRLGMYI